eukprot:TRINITY_DN470_c0_g4_i1.p1 TRINITY_DN470_c0_g4~~TRINITY_DN470_c0_g4_i1.p1  ORF type:complete len:650 (-),score=280.08 TRINITY_DN470_c0_g4_i1:242-2191(-)
MMKLMGKKKKSKLDVGIDLDALRNHVRLFDKYDVYTREILKLIQQQNDAAAAVIANSTALASQLKSFSSTISADSLVLGGCTRVIGEHIQRLAELQLRNCNQISGAIFSLKSFIENDLNDLKHFSRQQDSDVQLTRNLRRMTITKPKGEQENLDALYGGACLKVVDTNEKSQFLVLEKLCEYIEEQHIYLKRSYELSNDVLPEIQRYKEQAKRLKERYNVEIEDRNSSAPKQSLFGLPLQKILAREKTKVPTIVTDIIEHLENHALEVEGIFRIPGDQKEIEYIKKILDRGHTIDFSTVRDPHTVCAVLKLFLRQLPEPVFLFKNFNPLIDAISRNADESLQLAAIINIINDLPLANIRLFYVILQLCHKVAHHSDINRMTSKNLAPLIGPNLIYTNDTTNLLVDITSGTRVVNLLFANSESVIPLLEEIISIKEENEVENYEEIIECNDEMSLRDGQIFSNANDRLLPRSKSQKHNSVSKQSLNIATSTSTVNAKSLPNYSAAKLSTLQLDNEQILATTANEILDRSSTSGWFIIGYKSSTTLELQHSGKGSVNELIQYLDDTQVQYAVIRIQELASKGFITPKDIFIAWTGPSVPRIEASKKRSHIAEITQLLKPFHVELSALSKQNFTLEIVIDRAGPLSGSHVID